MWVGNPADPSLLECGLFRNKPSWWSFRAGYLDDWVYQQEFRENSKISHTKTFTKLSTYAGLLTLNFKNRVDVYGLVGSSRIQIDQEIFTKRALGWGIGTKWVFWKEKDFFFGGDIKYFETNQKPRYFLMDGLAYNIVTPFRLEYSEIQAALGICCRAWIFAPYIQGTYLITHIQPQPPVVLVRFPEENAISDDVPIRSSVGKKNWGMALGLTLVDSSKATLSVEWRAFNQNAIDVNGAVRF